MYVVVLPSSAVTIICILFSPAFNSSLPTISTSAAESSATADIFKTVMSFGTDIAYSVTSLLNSGDITPSVISKLANLELLDSLGVVSVGRVLLFDDPLLLLLLLLLPLPLLPLPVLFDGGVVGSTGAGSVTVIFFDAETSIYCPFRTAFDSLETTTLIVPVDVGVTVILFEKVLGSPVIEPSTNLIVPLVPAPEIVAVRSTVLTLGTLTVIVTDFPLSIVFADEVIDVASTLLAMHNIPIKIINIKNTFLIFFIFSPFIFLESFVSHYTYPLNLFLNLN